MRRTVFSSTDISNFHIVKGEAGSCKAETSKAITELQDELQYDFGRMSCYAEQMQIVETPTELIRSLAPKSRLMGVDLGSKTIGLALGDSQHKIATPFFTIRRKKFGPDAAALAEIVAAESVGGMVMGLPLNMDGSAGPRVQATQAFLRNLTNLDNFPDLPVLLWDERLSTAAVERTLLEADTSRAKRADVIDKMAAAYILQGAIDAVYGV